MAQLKSTVVQGSLRVTDTLYTNDISISKSQTKNWFLATPSAADGAPTFRAIASADLPVATTSAIGGVKVGTNISVSSGTISVATATTGVLGVMKVGTGLGVSSGTVSVSYGSTANTAVQGNQTIFTLNGSTKNSGSGASFYAPTTSGTAGYILKAGGANTAPDWIQYVPIANGGTGTTTAPTQYGVIYASSTTSYSSTAKGATNAILTASGANQAPAWSSAATLASATSAAANTAAYTDLTLGNNANVSTTTAHSEGRIYLYSAATHYHAIVGTSTTTHYTHTLPNNTGTLVSLSNGTEKGSTTKPVYVSSEGIITECNTYGGGTAVTLNGASKAANSASFYAPTSAGASGRPLISAGSGAPSWYAGLTLTGPDVASYVATFNGTTDATASTGSVILEGGLLVKKKTYLTNDIISGTTNYGSSLPASGTAGRIFFQTSISEYELPAGGTQGQALIKASNSDRDVTWGPVGGIMQPNTTTKYYVTGSSSNVQNTEPAIFDTAIYVQSHVLYGAAWNDYAEYREANIKEPGRVIIEQGNDTLQISTERLQPGAEIISDTYGFAIGETVNAKTPIATSGRVLAYPYEDREIFRQNIGKPVCSGPNGTVSIMAQDEYEKYGYCAIGIISAVPDYEEWGEKKVKVNGRVWIRVK